MVVGTSAPGAVVAKVVASGTTVVSGGAGAAVGSAAIDGGAVSLTGSAPAASAGGGRFGGSGALRLPTDPAIITVPTRSKTIGTITPAITAAVGPLRRRGGRGA
jgi:hypothetical protein